MNFCEPRAWTIEGRKIAKNIIFATILLKTSRFKKVTQKLLEAIKSDWYFKAFTIAHTLNN